MPHSLQDRILPGESLTVGDELYSADNQKWLYFKTEQGIAGSVYYRLYVFGYKPGANEVEAPILADFPSAETSISIEILNVGGYAYPQPTLVVRSSPGGTIIWHYNAPVEFIDAQLDYLVLQDDGNFVFYVNGQTSVVWASGTDGQFN